MLFGVTGLCADCGDERILVPVDDSGDFCCTDCDAAVHVFGAEVAAWISSRHRRAG